MKVELSVYNQQFIINLFQKHSLLESIIKKMVQSSVEHPDSDEYIECELTKAELKELVGELSYEANHNRSKRISEHACEAADSLEVQIWDAK